jgi:putative DNA primase/helicase
MMPGDDDLTGAAVRLGHFNDCLGIAEGIETALRASDKFHVPCWAALSASGLQTFIWPKGLRELHIFGDNDAKFGGQAAAYALAHRAACAADAPKVIVHIPDRVGTDWADDEPAAIKAAA